MVRTRVRTRRVRESLAHFIFSREPAEGLACEEVGAWLGDTEERWTVLVEADGSGPAVSARFACKGTERCTVSKVRIRACGAEALVGTAQAHALGAWSVADRADTGIVY